MKHRFINILNVNNKANGIISLCVVFLFVNLAGILAACQSTDNGLTSKAVNTQSRGNDLAIKAGTVYSDTLYGNRIISYNAGNYYSLDDEGNLIFFYKNGKISARAPLTLQSSAGTYKAGMEAKERETSFYISEEKTVIVYGGFYGKPIKVLTSDNMGKSWNTYTVTNKKIGHPIYTGFITKNDGWIVLGNHHTMDNIEHFIYKTTDAGKTWTDITGNINDLYRQSTTGAGFANDNIGFLCFKGDSESGPTIYWTQDGGETWTKLEVTLPEEFNEYRKTPMSPTFNGAKGLLAIQLSPLHYRVDIGIIYLTSDNYGKTWTYDRSLDALKIET